jgi:hypothetical protein
MLLRKGRAVFAIFKKSVNVRSDYCRCLSELESIHGSMNGGVKRFQRFTERQARPTVDPKRLFVQTPSHSDVRSLPRQGHRDQFSVYVHCSSTSEEDSQSTDKHAPFADRRIPSIEVCTRLVYSLRFSCPNLGRLPRTLLLRSLLRTLQYVPWDSYILSLGTTAVLLASPMGSLHNVCNDCLLLVLQPAWQAPPCKC